MRRAGAHDVAGQSVLQGLGLQRAGGYVRADHGHAVAGYHYDAAKLERIRAAALPNLHGFDELARFVRALRRPRVDPRHGRRSRPFQAPQTAAVGAYPA